MFICCSETRSGLGVNCHCWAAEEVAGHAGAALEVDLIAREALPVASLWTFFSDPPALRSLGEA